MNQDIEELGNIFEETQLSSHSPYYQSKEIQIDNNDNEKQTATTTPYPAQFNKEICKIFIRTFGCSHNQSDSEYMGGLLANEKRFQIVHSMDEADLVLVNSCTVKNPSQEAFMTVVRQARRKEKYIIVSGCVPQSFINFVLEFLLGQKYLPDIECYSSLGVTQIDQIVYVVDQTLKGNVVKLLKRKPLPSLNIPISGGCLGACSYCKTVQARGKLSKSQQILLNLFHSELSNK